MTFDVTIVGAGPAGSTTAKILAEKGWNILILEKERFPRDKPCGGGIPARVLHRYPYIVNDKIIEAYSYGGTVYSPSMKYKIELKKTTPIIATTLRKTFDTALVHFATDAGARLQEGTTVTGVSLTGPQTHATTATGEGYNSSIIVGADGVHSTIAKTLGMRKPGTQHGVCVLQEFPIPSPILDTYFSEKRRCLIHSRFMEQPGYGWVFPKKEHVNIGFGAIQPETGPTFNLRECYQKYLTYLKDQHLIPNELPEAPIKGGVTPVRPLEKTYMDRLLLVGDAGGFVNPLSGEGIYYAMASGEIAAQLITEALEKNDCSSQFLSQDQTRWHKDFGKDLDLIYTILQRGGLENRDRVFQIASEDEPLTALLVGVITGEISGEKNKWKIIRRYFYASLRHRFRRKKETA